MTYVAVSMTTVRGAGKHSTDDRLKVQSICRISPAITVEHAPDGVSCEWGETLTIRWADERKTATGTAKGSIAKAARFLVNKAPTPANLEWFARRYGCLGPRVDEVEELLTVRWPNGITIEEWRALQDELRAEWHSRIGAAKLRRKREREGTLSLGHKLASQICRQSMTLGALTMLRRDSLVIEFAALSEAMLFYIKALNREGFMRVCPNRECGHGQFKSGTPYFFAQATSTAKKYCSEPCKHEGEKERWRRYARKQKD